MTSNKLPPVGRDRPYPWSCFECGAREVFPQATDYTLTRKHDEHVYTIRIPDLALPTCRKCGAQVFTADADDRIIEAMRAQAGLLGPQEICQRRSRLDVTQEHLAESLGVPLEELSRWESGAWIQSRAMDNLLRLFFESEEARTLLRQRSQSLPSPMTVTHQPLPVPEQKAS